MGGEWWQTKFNVSPGPGLWPLVLGPFGPDLGPDLDLTWDLDLSLTIDLSDLVMVYFKLFKTLMHIYLFIHFVMFSAFC